MTEKEMEERMNGFIEEFFHPQRNDGWLCDYIARLRSFVLDNDVPAEIEGKLGLAGIPQVIVKITGEWPIPPRALR